MTALPLSSVWELPGFSFITLISNLLTSNGLTQVLKKRFLWIENARELCPAFLRGGDSTALRLRFWSQLS